MKLNKILPTLALLFMVLMMSCKSGTDENVLCEQGVSKDLALFRADHYRDVHYNLMFSIPRDSKQNITGQSEITVFLKDKVDIYIDFCADSSDVKKVMINKKDVPYVFENEHIIIAAENVIAGINKVEIEFVADDQSLNRRDDFMYTLLVPDRARTLFPCFDQPGIKATFALQLEIPSEWQAVANGNVRSMDEKKEEGRKLITFNESKPISTYLFSFVVGKMYCEKFTRDGRIINIYHRETDPKKVNQCKDIADEIFYDLKWQEDYTGIPYPFEKYDAIIVPGFQFGGMEHVGATLYNDSRMFLNENPTLDEQLERSVLIAHETSHMWFGDLVTMKWFNDVWTKEVFANFFGSMIAEPHFPGVNHQLKFMLDYLPSAYAEDRTEGTNPIHQDLDNLKNAGLMYGNIIYKKSPVVMNMLFNILGKDNFRKGMQEYLKTYSYGCATWDDLITILDKYTDTDLKKWSMAWCDEKGMPEITAHVRGDVLTVEQKDRWGRGLCWPQTIKYAVVSKNNTDTVDVVMSMDKNVVEVKLKHEADNEAYIIPNVDGNGYGFFRIENREADKLFDILETSDDELLRGSLSITLHENMLNKVISSDMFVKRMLSYVKNEKNELLYSSALGYINNCNRIFPVKNAAEIEETLWKLITESKTPQGALQAFRAFRGIASTKASIDKLYNIWKSQKSPATFVLSEYDCIKMSYKLAILLPEKASEITGIQLERITNPDRKKEYAFISPSVSADKSVRDSVFNSLLDVKNRTIEPWASAALANLNNAYRQSEAVEYITPALEEIVDIQRTGDIFFPGSWAWSLLYYHNTPAAAEKVKAFFEAHPDYPQLIKNKILQRADHLYRL